MTPEAMAALHARAFDAQGRAWSAQEFTKLLGNPHVFAVTEAQCFALGRVIVDEAELLTIATDPAHRRAGLGRAMLLAFEGAARARGATQVFLEVSADNAAAQRLYLSAGYEKTAHRPGYYQGPDGRAVDALILHKSLA